jgi:hypothetical protein
MLMQWIRAIPFLPPMRLSFLESFILYARTFLYLPIYSTPKWRVNINRFANRLLTVLMELSGLLRGPGAGDLFLLHYAIVVWLYTRTEMPCVKPEYFKEATDIVSCWTSYPVGSEDCGGFQSGFAARFKAGVSGPSAASGC